MTGGILFLLMIGLMLLGLPIAIGIGYSSILYILVTGIKPLLIVGSRLADGIDSFSFLAITMFIMAGCMMEQYGLSERLINVSAKLCGNAPGSSGTIAIVACAIFAALTGSGAATVVAIGGLTIPMMIDQGYSREEATAVVTTGGALGPLIPPSITMIVYGTAMGLSVPAMFMGAVIPGLLTMMFLIITNILLARRRGIKDQKVHYSAKEKLKALREAILALLMPVIVLGGIYSGLFTPTEAGAIAVMYCAFLGVIYRKFTWASFKKICIDTVHTSAMVMFIVACASLFGLILTVAKIPQTIVTAATTVLTSKIIYLIVLTIIILIVGALLETNTATLILAPILIPVGLALGLDPLHLGVIWCMNLIIGLVTPPFGLNLFTGVSVGQVSFVNLAKKCAPYIAAQIFALLICTFWDDVILVLPRLLGMWT